MGPYRPLAYQGPRLSTPYRPVVAACKEMGQTFDQILGWPPCTGDVCRLLFHGGATVLGIHVGLKEKGPIAVLGWVIGLGEGFAAILDLVSLYKRATGTHPPEK